MFRGATTGGGHPVKSLPSKSNERIADIIENRSPAGPQETVQGWHKLLKNLLNKMAPYMREGQLVTFQTLNDNEKAFFEALHLKITVPPSARALFIPPSVLFQMLYGRPDGTSRSLPEHSPENPPDDGIVLANRSDGYNIIVNALFARPPFAPAIDVYEAGQLLAGYVYSHVDECVENITHVLDVHLQSRS
jgi:hypothetical protein